MFIVFKIVHHLAKYTTRKNKKYWVNNVPRLYRPAKMFDWCSVQVSTCRRAFAPFIWRAPCCTQKQWRSKMAQRSSYWLGSKCSPAPFIGNCAGPTHFAKTLIVSCNHLHNMTNYRTSNVTNESTSLLSAPPHTTSIKDNAGDRRGVVFFPLLRLHDDPEEVAETCANIYRTKRNRLIILHLHQKIKISLSIILHWRQVLSSVLSMKPFV